MALGTRKFVINWHSIFAQEKRDYGLAVTDHLTVIDHIRKLPARRIRCIENMFMNEWQLSKLKESEYL